MKEIYRSFNVVELSIIKKLLSEADIAGYIFDEHIGTLYQGVMCVMPRLMVADSDYESAEKIVKEAGFEP